MSELTKRLREPIPADVPGIVAERAKAANRIEALEKCLRDLLDDTQHAEHSCDDPDCPVAKARALLEDK